MTNKFNRYLTNDPAGPKGVLANFQHATDVFVENYYRLSPKYKFLFHAYIEFDDSVASVSKLSPEISLLVKTTGLPSFAYDTVTKNKYNRKKVVYKGINYDPLTLTFHDDNAGIMNTVYSAYNDYFSNDSFNSTPAAWRMDNKWANFKYGMDVDTPVRFIKRISLYTLSRQKYEGYTLWGPKIKSWKHGEVDYAAGADVIESSMTIEFESVSYSYGDVAEGTPDGFASLLYDHVKSPLDTAGSGGGNSNSVFGTQTTSALRKSPSFLDNALAAQQFNNKIDLPTGQPPEDLFSPDFESNLIGGLFGAEFPSDSQDDVIIAEPKSVNDQFNNNSFPPAFGGGDILAT
jgi:hypothetical protein